MGTKASAHHHMDPEIVHTFWPHDKKPLTSSGIPNHSEDIASIQLTPAPKPLTQCYRVGYHEISLHPSWKDCGLFHLFYESGQTKSYSV